MGQTKGGSTEFGLGGSLMYPIDADFGSLSIMGSVGTFLTDSVEIGATILGALTIGEELGGMLYFQPFIEYYFLGGGPKFTPFAGVRVGGLLMEDELAEAAVVDPHVGFKYFASEDVSYNVVLDYPFLVGEEVTADNGTIIISFGASMYF